MLAFSLIPLSFQEPWHSFGISTQRNVCLCSCVLQFSRQSLVLNSFLDFFQIETQTVPADWPQLAEDHARAAAQRNPRRRNGTHLLPFNAHPPHVSSRAWLYPLPLRYLKGLGKTVQTVAFLTHLLENGVKGPHIIVAPSSTLGKVVGDVVINYAVSS